ncbi:uncharacterized protein [Littorina saxatilis]|uniref:uncharacterized protein n=1 Tax=Littorina saxatilis TaxID=31220 RepID=UPI0038B5B6CF
MTLSTTGAPSISGTQALRPRSSMISLPRSWMESVGYQYEVRLPVQLRITAHNFDPPFERIFNLYNYKEDQNNPWDFSISACFNSSHRKEYTLTIPGNYSQYVGVDQNNFQFFFTLAVTAHAQVSALRVANVKFDFDDVNIYASFSLLDKAPITGDVQDAEPEMDLTQASSAMEADITSGTFFIELQLPTDGVLQKLQVTKFTVGVAPTLQPAPPPPQQHHHQQQRQRLEDNTASRRPQLLQHEEQRQRRATRRGAGDEGLGLDVKTAAPLDTASTYSAGAMAGLGIPMVIIGYGLAFIVTLLTYRRVTARHALDVDNPLTEIRPSAAQLP